MSYPISITFYTIEWVILFKFSPTWNCVSLLPPTTSKCLKITRRCRIWIKNKSCKLNPCAAKTVYTGIRFKTNFRINKIPPKCGRYVVNSIIQFGRCLYFINDIIFFIHLKLEIASAIPTWNEWKLVTNNSAAQGLIFFSPSILLLLRTNEKTTLGRAVLSAQEG